MKKLTILLLFSTINYLTIADNLPITGANNEESNNIAIVTGQDNNESAIDAPNVTVATTTLKVASSPIATTPTVEPETKAATTAPTVTPHKDKGIVSTILGWFSGSDAENKSESSTTTKKTVKPLIIGLALGGGAAKGFAHIGVIKALEENGIRPHIITGTSAGSLVGSLYAYGYSPQQLEKIAYQLDGINLADFTLSSSGLIKGQKLQDFVNKQLHNQPLQKLKIKFTAVATDLDSGQSVGFNYGNPGAAVRASCAVPNIFLPVKINDRRYVDGGLSAPVPVSYAKKMGANLVIAVDITSKPEHTKASGFLSNFDQTINIMGVKLLNEQLKLANFTIKPDISKLSSFDFDNKKQAINLGYKATISLIPKIKAQILQIQHQQ